MKERGHHPQEKQMLTSTITQGAYKDGWASYANVRLIAPSDRSHSLVKLIIL